MNTDESLKVDLSRLARVRENQRKSRAKRRNYIQELEQRLASSKGDAKRKDIERKLLVQKIEAENRKLRDLLIFSGMRPSVIETYLHMDDNSNTTPNIAIPALQGSEKAVDLPYQKSMHSLAEESAASLEPEDSAPGVPSQQSPGPVKHSASFARPPVQPVPGGACQQSAGLAKMSSSSLERPEDSIPSLNCQQSCDPVQDRTQEGHDFKPLPTDQSFCGCQPVDDELDSWPFNDEVSNSTLCATAEQLVNQYNIRGIDMDVIRRKLRPGFSKGRPLAKDAGFKTISY
ncbi:hypothetical protein CNMCM8927_000223 [Aspergillus lentulus]|uniref:BZIP domain-containing protein n=1 Tax=Aspergillus lentulus TaxID=293939 RepID=A0AAN6BN47_ASPLE|nr:hypothetical protein CNMCM8060_007373 [Aspergillus lentulus]KAF4191612.1 hypothetical protein CNMCM8694_001641 [Aspergillus lentulus]KAF4202411.1 hypothetical protein CNMCM8927_000223 [Aspergillus lentulus]